MADLTAIHSWRLPVSSSPVYQTALIFVKITGPFIVLAGGRLFYAGSRSHLNDELIIIKLYIYEDP